MGDTISKLENFLFDILGLVLPGLIFLTILILPISLVDIPKIPPNVVDSSLILSALLTISKVLKTYWASNSNLLISLIMILSYLIGHFVKVFSIIKYDFLNAIFDKSINKVINWAFEKLKHQINKVYNKFFNKNIYKERWYMWVKDMLVPLKNILAKTFVFRPPDYFPDNDSLKTDCVNIINGRVGTSYPDKWYSVYKFSTVITSQENIKSLSGNFLAKYNLYRSLAFIFIFATFYYNVFFQASYNYIPAELKKIASLILLTSVFLWFTFHYKYKRYWTLCGNETLVSLFYFLNKKKINEI